MTTRPRWMVRLFAVFGAVVVSFVAATAFEHWRLVAIDQASRDIAENASPSIERLTAARSELRRVQVLLREYLDARAAGALHERATIESARAAMDRDISDYLAIQTFPGEQALWADLLRAQNELHDAVERSLVHIDAGDFAAAEEASRTSVSAAAEHLSTAIARDVEFNATRAHDLALQIQQVRGRSTYLAFGLDALCALIAVAGALALHRALRAHAALVESHEQLLVHRASELEQFAGSVAHDILSPLNSVGLALELAARPGTADATRAGWIKRGTSALARVERLVSGLLEFSRAGADPGAAAGCDVRSTLADLAAELQVSALDAGAELDVVLQSERSVRCNPGVLTSMVSNLARNAIKYIGDGPARRIDVRVHDVGDRVRFEVEDTGPGLPDGLEAHVFDPYVRGPHATQPGIGLGLATVKRLVDAHRGTVGVDSVAGRGCTFWFELPAVAGSAPKSTEDAAREGVPAPA